MTKLHLVAAALSVAVVAVLAATPALLGDRVRDALAQVGSADPGRLWVAGACFAAALALAGCAWRAALSLCDAPTTRRDAAARYAVGSLVNAATPARLGSAVRFALYARLVRGEGRLWRTGGVATAVGVARALWLAVLVAIAAASGVLPAWPLALLAGAVVAAGIACLLARRLTRRRRITHVLDAFGALGSSPRAAARLVGWIGLATAARIGAAAAIAAAFGIESPLAAAFLVVPALDLAATLPLTPGNIGVASAAVAFALHAHGAPGNVALGSGIAFSAVETLASLAAGTTALVYLAGGVPEARRWRTAAAGASFSVVAAAFGATVLFSVV
jgi:uncharacterized membrane protein YbhN (UPF0104 family)